VFAVACSASIHPHPLRSQNLLERPPKYRITCLPSAISIFRLSTPHRCKSSRRAPFSVSSARAAQLARSLRRCAGVSSDLHYALSGAYPPFHHHRHRSLGAPMHARAIRALLRLVRRLLRTAAQLRTVAWLSRSLLPLLALASASTCEP